MLEKSIRAQFDAESITVYQAYNKEIAQAAVAAQTFVSPPFKMSRMTWIKPSFLWMMYRAGWGEKKDQERILAIQVKRSGFEWALKNSCLSHFQANIHPNIETWKAALEASPVRLQWDPEKDIHLQNLPYRSIQIGLSEIAVQHFVSDWIVGIQDITSGCKEIQILVKNGQLKAATDLLPKEEIYPLSPAIAQHIHASQD